MEKKFESKLDKLETEEIKMLSINFAGGDVNELEKLGYKIIKKGDDIKGIETEGIKMLTISLAEGDVNELEKLGYKIIKKGDDDIIKIKGKGKGGSTGRGSVIKRVLIITM